MTSQLEHRSRVRITWRFWVAVEGIDDFPRLRYGNISASGVYFEVDRHIGAPGSVQWLHLAANEHATPVEVMGRVVRLDGDAHHLHAGANEGVALAFMVEDETTRQSLLRLVREVATLRMEQEEGGGHGLERAGSGVGPGVQRLLLETTMAMSVGQLVTFSIQMGEESGTLKLRGRVAQVQPLSHTGEGTLSRISIQMIESAPRSSGLHAVPTGETTTVDLQFSDLVVSVPDEVEPEDVSSSGDLMGHLSRVKLTSLLAFLERSRFSGELRLEDGVREAVIFIDRGRLLDVEGRPPFPTPRTALAHVVRWQEGTFHFVAGEVQREDRLQIRSESLLNP